MAHKTYINDVDGADKAVLFIHGFLGSTEHFERFICHVNDSVAVYNILLKGHGGSVSDFGKASMYEWKKQISDIADRLCDRYEQVYIAAHSMGTFFAVEEAIKHSDRVKSIYLLQTPLKIGLKPAAAINTIRSFFDVFSDDETAKAYKEAHSVKLNFRLWEYISWIPRYMELFRESKKARTTILELDTPCLIFQSKRDELVSMKSLRYIPKKCNIKTTILDNSAHFIYDDEEEKLLVENFVNMIS